MTIELTRQAPDAVILRCSRADGSSTWQRSDGPRAQFFALHDLQHYAVESVLDLREGFYGLIAAGWEIADTTGKGRRGALPAEAQAVEHLVGMLDIEAASGSESSAADLNGYAAAHAAQNNRPVPIALTEKSLAEIRAKAAKLHSQWFALPTGETMRFSFPP